MRLLVVGTAMLVAIVSSSVFAQESTDANGPSRQGNMCRQRVQPGQPEGLTFFAPCEPTRAAARPTTAAARPTTALARTSSETTRDNYVAIDANGPARQGTMCRQRIQPGQSEGLAFFSQCDQRTANARR